MSETSGEPCVHHWILGLPEDDVVRGRCKRCGIEREYPASVESPSRPGPYDAAAALNRTVRLLPDLAPEPALQGSGATPW